MGFHKRYIDDEQIISIYRENGCQAVIDHYTRKVDAIILSGELSIKVSTLINNTSADCLKRLSILMEGACQKSSKI